MHSNSHHFFKNNNNNNINTNMMATAASSSAPPLSAQLVNLNQAIEAAQSWTPKRMPFQVAASLDDDKVKTIDVLPTIGHNVRVTSNSPKHWLPSQCNQNNPQWRNQVLLTLFVGLCKPCGFSIVSSGWRKVGNRIELKCCRGWHATNLGHIQDGHCPGKKKVSTSKKPKAWMGQEKCPFKFAVCWCDKNNRWCLPKKQPGCSLHLGHFQKDPMFVHQLMRHLPNTEQQLANDCTQIQIKDGTVAHLLQHRNNLVIDPSQIRHQRKKKAPHPSQSTPADELIAQMNATKDASYVALYGAYETSCLTIVQRKMKVNAASSSQPIDTKLSPTLFDDGVDSAAQLCRKIRIRDNLEITGSGGMILLAIAWTTDEARRLFHLFPECTADDCVEGTNAEERSLHQSSGKDSCNNTFSYSWAFLPNKARWAFDWLHGTAIPALHGPEVLRRMKLKRTDQDDQMHGAFLAQTGPNGYYPNCIHGLCAFHKLDRNLRSKNPFDSCMTFFEQKNYPAFVEFHMVLSWMWSICTQLETEAECLLSVDLLVAYLEDEQSHHRAVLPDHLRRELVTFIRRRMQSCKESLYSCYFQNVPSFGVTTTQMVEAENGSLLTSGEGPSHAHSIDKSHAKMRNINNKRNLAKAKRNCRMMDTDPSNQEACDKIYEGITRKASEKLCHERNESWKMHVWCCSPTKFYVRTRECDRKRFKELWDQDRPGVDFDSRKWARVRCYCPEFDRTRVVELRQVNGDTFITCSCGTSTQKQHFCRHMCALVQREPKQADCNPRWWSIWMAPTFMKGDSEGASSLLHELDKVWWRSHSMPGMLMDPSEMPEHIKTNCTTRFGTKPLEWFEEALPDKPPLLRGNGYWTHDPIGKELLRRTKLRMGGVANPLDNGQMPAGLQQDFHLTEEAARDHQKIPKEKLELIAFEETNPEGLPIRVEPTPHSSQDTCVSSITHPSRGSGFGELQDIDDDKLESMMKSSTPCMAFINQFNDIVKGCRTKEDWMIIRNGLQGIHTQLMERKQPPPNLQPTGGTFSVSSGTHRSHGVRHRSPNRKRKLNSPTKKQVRRNQRKKNRLSNSTIASNLIVHHQKTHTL